MTTTRVPTLFTGDPFSLDDAFRSFMRPFRWDTAEVPAIRVDVTESDQEYLVKAEIPGVRKEDIHVEIEGPQVMITAEVKKDVEPPKGARVLHTERRYGYASRMFTLGFDIDRDKAGAKYADGVLTLTLPKKAEAHVGSLKSE